MTAIASVHARQILDSRGNPTVEVEVTLASGASGSAAVPSGASASTRPSSFATAARRGWARVSGAPSRTWTAALGLDARDQRTVDTTIELDGTPTKSRPWARTRSSASRSRRPSAADVGLPLYRSVGGDTAATLPVPMLNVINGGAHAQNSLDFQEFMLVPAGAESFSEALRIGAETYHHLKAILHERGLSTLVGDEGFAPDLGSADEACG